MNSVLAHSAVHRYSGRWAALKTPAWFGTTIFLHLPVCGSDLTSQKCKHHTSSEQSLASSSIRAMSYQATKPPRVPRTYTKGGDHLTNLHSSPTGGWVLFSKQGALVLLSQNHQPLPLTQKNRPNQGRQSPAAQHFWVQNGRIFPKVSSKSLSFAGGRSTLTAVQPQASTESLPLQPPSIWNKSWQCPGRGFAYCPCSSS